MFHSKQSLVNSQRLSVVFQPLSLPAAALDVMIREMSQYDQEVLCVVNMNTRFQPINFNMVSVGDINASIAAIPNILKLVFMSNASSFMLLHITIRPEM